MILVEASRIAFPTLPTSGVMRAMGRQSALALVTAALALFVAFENVHACTCADIGRPCESLRVPTVFIGRVIATTSRIDTTRWNTDGYTFLVERAYRGVARDTVTVWAGGPCGIGFVTGESYLVYAGLSDTTVASVLTTHKCSRTRRLADAGDDIAYLEAIARSPSASYIHGSIRRRTESTIDIVPATIILEGEVGMRTVMSDGRGEFMFGPLPDGTYRVRSEVPRGFVAFRFADTVRVSGHDCRETWVEWVPVVQHDPNETMPLAQRVIVGGVFHSDYRPAVGSRVQFKAGYALTIYTFDTADSGRFELRSYKDVSLFMRGVVTGSDGNPVEGAWQRVDADWRDREEVELFVP